MHWLLEILVLSWAQILNRQQDIQVFEFQTGQRGLWTKRLQRVVWVDVYKSILTSKWETCHIDWQYWYFLLLFQLIGEKKLNLAFSIIYFRMLFSLNGFISWVWQMNLIKSRDLHFVHRLRCFISRDYGHNSVNADFGLREQSGSLEASRNV